MDEKLVRSIAADAAGLTGPTSIEPVGGGDINEAYAVRGGGVGVFVKLNRRAAAGMFATEHAALAEIAATGTLRVPKPLGYGERDGVAYLALELLEFGPTSARAEAELGAALARLHQIQQPWFGWHRDNFIGRTPQPNPAATDWIDFFATSRLRFQVARLLDRGGPPGRGRQCDALIARLPELFAGFSPRPSLLHGDLWGGNHATLADGHAVAFDPASYYGCRETDLAMTELFGGFGRAFYRGYEAQWPLDPGYPKRRGLYQLYHVLNHANLFGGGYLGQAQRLMERI